jgi:4-amino-4-deoxy-L-arabinose transferase-like glycosyltransferase
MQIPLGYTFAFLASGWENEYLARLIPALLSLACLPTLFVLGRMIFNRRAGEWAALLLVLTPTFVRWASSGYVDLPMAFFYTLSAIFVWRLRESHHTIDAVLLGISLGLAAWTKNAGLVGIALIYLWLILSQIKAKESYWRLIILAVGVCLVITAPWYIRNWLEAGLIVPPTAWTEQAQRTLSNIAVFITEPINFALTGWLVVIAMVAGIIQAVRKRYWSTGEFLLLFLTLPFFGIWWLLVSYDPRFLLLFLPLFTVIAGGWIAQLETSISKRLQNPVRILASILIIGLTIYMLWISVEFKDEIIHHPFMGDEAKKAIVLKK